jgi:hypothetical protein
MGCSTLINLGHDLLECYQRLDDLNPLRSRSGSDVSTELANLNALISHHSERCHICRRLQSQIDGTPEMAALIDASPDIPPNGWFG